MNVYMSKTRSIGLLILFSAIILSGAVLLASAVTPPNKFSGDVTLNGTDAPIGTTIEAFIDGDLRGSIVVESTGEYEHLSVDGIASDNGTSVTFKVGGLPADPTTATWIAMIGHVQILDLTAGDAPAGDADITPPGITITTPASDTSSTTATMTVRGTASDENLDKVQVQVGSGNWIDAEGTTDWSATVTLAPGSYTIHARANDTYGNSGKDQVGNVSYTVVGSNDTTPPTVSIDSPSDGDAFTTTTITVRGTASDNEDVRMVQVKVGSGSWMNATGTTSWTKTVTMSRGLHTIEVRAVDTTGLLSETASITVAYNSPGIAPSATPTGTDAQPVPGNVPTVNSTSTITETNTPVTTSTKDPATKPETTNGLPGFEAMSAIAGLLAVAYMLIRR